MIKKIAKALLPAGTTRRHRVVTAAKRVHILPQTPPDVEYAEWIERTEPYLWQPISALDYNPLISIVVPVFNAPPKYLLPMVYSVVNQQGYDNWELILVNSSTDKKCRELTQKCSQIDTRIKIVEVKNNLGIAGNTNLGIKHAKGAYIGLLDHDDVLPSRALFEIAHSLQVSPRPQLVYSDEDKLSEDGRYRFGPFFKPDWSPFMFRHVNFINHFTIIEKELLDKAGGYAKDVEGAQDYDLFLRIIDTAPVIVHIPKILYHWREAHGSTNRNFNSKKNIVDAGMLALQNHLLRNKEEGVVSHILKQPGFYKINYKPKNKNQVAVIIPPAKVIDQYRTFIHRLRDGLDKCALDYEIYASGISSEEKSTKIVSVNADSNHNFLKQAVAQTDADILIIINCAFEPINKGWADRLVGLVSQCQSIGVASPQIRDRRANMIIDAGYVEFDNNALALFQWLPVDSNTYLGNTLWGRNVSATSGRINVMRRSVYDKYFSDVFPPHRGLKPYKKLLEDGLQVVIDNQNAVDYTGDLNSDNRRTRYFNANLRDLRKGISLPKSINIPSGGHL